MNAAATEKLAVAHAADATDATAHPAASSPGLTVSLDLVGRACASEEDPSAPRPADGSR